jgi:hypothetical protein
VSISTVDAYSRMELCTIMWLNYDHEDGGVVGILVVDAYSGVDVCMSIFLIRKSFLKNLQTQMDTSLNKAQHKQELLMWTIFGSGRNVYVVEERF